MLIQGAFDLLDNFPSSQFITGDGVRNACLSRIDLHYLKRDFVFKSGQWRGNSHRSIFDLRKDASVDYVVVGHSDISTNHLHQNFLRALGVKKLFGVNLKPIYGFSSSIPLGLTNDCEDSPLHRLFGNTRLLYEAVLDSNIPKIFSPQLYVNFSASTNGKERDGLLDVISQLGDTYRILRNHPDFTYSGRFRYLSAMRKSSLVLCPAGNGVDTHRFWETLYMGATPIVLKHPYTEDLYRSFPIIELTNWSELNDLELIEQKWVAARKLSWDSNLLKLDYWTTLINQ